MRLLFIASCGFGNMSWFTSWPRLFHEMGHELDVFVMKYTGNPFHANPYVKNITVIGANEAHNHIKNAVEKQNYDFILLPYSSTGQCAGVPEVLEQLKAFKNVYSGPSIQIPGVDLPSRGKPEWFFTKEEADYVNNGYKKGSILFFPCHSNSYCKSEERLRNIDYGLIRDFVRYSDNIIVTHGGSRSDHIPAESLKRMEDCGIKLLWENYNCFNDESGTITGKQFALISGCGASVHGWSGSICMAMGGGNPYVVVSPQSRIRGNTNRPYVGIESEYGHYMKTSQALNCFNHSVWCVTEKASDVYKAVETARSGGASEIIYY